MAVKIGATVEKITTLKDGGLKIVFDTQEASIEQGGEWMGVRNKFGWLIFAGDQAAEVFIPDDPPKEFNEEKSQSQLLRAVLYVWWEKIHPGVDFNTFYRSKMETLRGWIKDKIRALEEVNES